MNPPSHSPSYISPLESFMGPFLVLILSYSIFMREEMSLTNTDASDFGNYMCSSMSLNHCLLDAFSAIEFSSRMAPRED